ncbi:2,5-didehydrogluconate reductase DkgB [Marinomonas ostreistagni]|uniref:2,5-didehydrogluconate reductase DkgB n=1 Tax=Marinomonas ostreistagni TaxID=359209 RepID=UPI001950D146|nr:2,5-didehydrogluconate reductase DkgB [Marinomonas ostreistagni]MBM6550948.1 2,5-didehydrogluconate reductase DkgB [Marinomonas ostreistagni]
MKMPNLGMGTFRLKGETAYNSVQMALEEGFRHIDTAQMYDNEEEVGRAIADSGVPREELFVTTKIHMDHMGKEDLLPSVHESLKKLQLDYVDLLLIHWPTPANGEGMEEYLGELLKAQEQGLTQNIGVSNFTIELLEKAQSILPKGVLANNQIEVHPYLQNAKIRDYADKAGIHITGYMPFAVGKVLKDAEIHRIADKHKATPAQVVIAWALQQGLTVIPSSTKRENLQDNIFALKIELDPEDMAKISTLDRGDRQVDPDFAPAWDE